MRKYLLVSLVFILAIMISIPTYAQSAKEAVMGLKKLQARCQSGILYRDYSNAVGDAKFPVNLFAESSDAKRYPELMESINKVLQHHEFAVVIWSEATSNQGFIGVEYPLGRNIERLYPKAEKWYTNKDYHAGSLLPYIWGKASEELKNTTELLSKAENGGNKRKTKR